LEIFLKRKLLTAAAVLTALMSFFCFCLPDKERAVTVFIDGESQEISTSGKTVAEVLSMQNIALGADDKTLPAQEEECGGFIEVIRVTKDTIIEEKKIAYPVERVQSETMFAGQERIKQKGVSGLEKSVYEIVLENGIEISRSLIEKTLVKEPVKQVVEIGNLHTTARGGEVLNFSKTLTMAATGYTHTGNMTYTDIWPYVGIVAVDPRVIPLRTRVFVEGYGYATAMDIGSAIKGNRIDLFFDTRAEAMKWGRRNVQVYLLEQ